jgi:hypothetical protein
MLGNSSVAASLEASQGLRSMELVWSHISLIEASRFEVLMAVRVRIMVFWDFTPCSLGNGYQMSEGPDASSSGSSFNPRMDAADTSGTLVPVHQTTR